MNSPERNTPARKSQPRHILGLQDEVEFGKYRGEKVEDIVDNDPGYIIWCADVGVVRWEDDVLELIEKKAATKARFKALREAPRTR